MLGFEVRTTLRSNLMTLVTVRLPTPKREIPAESLSQKALAQTCELARNELKRRTKECPRMRTRGEEMAGNLKRN